MVLTKEKMVEMEKCAKPLIEWMAKNLHPHTTIIVDSTSAELKESIAKVGATEAHQFAIERLNELIKKGEAR